MQLNIEKPRDLVSDVVAKFVADFNDPNSKVAANHKLKLSKAT